MRKRVFSMIGRSALLFAIAGIPLLIGCDLVPNAAVANGSSVSAEEDNKAPTDREISLLGVGWPRRR